MVCTFQVIAITLESSFRLYPGYLFIIPCCFFLLQLPLTEVVEPVDFEEYVSSHAPGVEPGPLRQLMEFPQDDLELLHQDKECITLEPPLPEEEE